MPSGPSVLVMKPVAAPRPASGLSQAAWTFRAPLRPEAAAFGAGQIPSFLNTGSGISRMIVMMIRQKAGV